MDCHHNLQRVVGGVLFISGVLVFLCLDLSEFGGGSEYRRDHDDTAWSLRFDDRRMLLFVVGQCGGHRVADDPERNHQYEHTENCHIRMECATNQQ